MIQLTDPEFHRLVDFVQKNYGIDLSRKRLLIEARMCSTLSERRVSSFSEYFDSIRNDRKSLTGMMDRLTTNHTYFMREPRHFEFLKDVILPEWKRMDCGKCLHVWSAGCSTGEEAYTAVMVMKEYFGPYSGWDYRTLATDLSVRALESAREGLYGPESLSFLPEKWKRRYFVRQGGNYRLCEEIRRQVFFHRMNLMDPFPFSIRFDLIFCRNVMIYFNQKSRDELISKFHGVLKKGGYLFLGHSETIGRNVTGFRYLEPSIYQKGS